MGWGWGGDDVGPKVRGPTVTLGSRRACLGPAWEAYRHPNASSSRILGSAPAPGSTFESHREHLTQREPGGRPVAGERAAESTSTGVRWDGPRGGPRGGSWFVMGGGMVGMWKVTNRSMLLWVGGDVF